MLRYQAEKAAREMIMSEYRHHRYEDELLVTGTLFHLEREALVAALNSDAVDALLLSYVDILGPTHMRALKNTLICFIAPLCRLAIDMGGNAELCFALSDFYINYLEGINTEREVKELFSHVALHYYDIVQRRERNQYSRPVAGAVRFIDRNLYGRCSVAQVAGHVGLERHYFSKVFTKQVGVTPAKYILMQKLGEGKRVLSLTAAPVTEVAESLGFYDVAHFSRRFKEAYGIPPSGISQKDMSRPQMRDKRQLIDEMFYQGKAEKEIAQKTNEHPFA